MWATARFVCASCFVLATHSGCGTSRVEVIERLGAAPVMASVSATAPVPAGSASELGDAGGPPPSSSVGAEDDCAAQGIVKIARYRFELRSTGACLGSGGETMSEGREALSTVVALDCGSDSLWQLIAVPGGFVEIRNLTNGLSLETYNGLSNAGTDIVLMPPEDEPAQHFEVHDAGGGYISLSLSEAPERCIAESFTGKAELAVCDMADPAQQWLLEDYTCVPLDGGL